MRAMRKGIQLNQFLSISTAILSSKNFIKRLYSIDVYKLSSRELLERMNKVQYSLSSPFLISIAITDEKTPNPNDQIDQIVTNFDEGARLVNIQSSNIRQVFAQVLQKRNEMLFAFSDKEIAPDLTPVTPGSVNFANKTTLIRQPAEIRDDLLYLKEFSIPSCVRIYDLSMLFRTLELQKEGLLPKFIHFMLHFGKRYPLPNDPSVIEFMTTKLEFLFGGYSQWTICSDEMNEDVLSFAIQNGGHFCVPENIELQDGSFVKSLSDLCKKYGRRIADSNEAKEILGLYEFQ